MAGYERTVIPCLQPACMSILKREIITTLINITLTIHLTHKCVNSPLSFSILQSLGILKMSFSASPFPIFFFYKICLQLMIECYKNVFGNK